MKKLTKKKRLSIPVPIKRRAKHAAANGKQDIDEEERILRAATIHLITHHGMFLVATGARKERIRGLRIWIITVTLRYTTGHEGYVGDLIFDGKDFTFLTPPEVRKERMQQIADDPKRMQKWNEYRASTAVLPLFGSSRSGAASPPTAAKTP